MNKYLYIGDNKIAGPLPLRKDEGAMTLNIKSLPKIEVNGTHSWEINQILEKDIDFVIAESSLKEGKIIVAVPISKPNTDVKENI